MTTTDVNEIERRSIKQSSSGDVEYFDFDYSEYFDPNDTITGVSLTINPTAELSEISAERIVTALNVRCLFSVQSAVVGKEYLISVKATTTNSKVKTLQLIVSVI